MRAAGSSKPRDAGAWWLAPTQFLQGRLAWRGRKLPRDPTKCDEIIRKPATSIEEVSAEPAERF